MPKKALPLLLATAHAAACVVFLALREPGISFLAERERARREWGYFFINSADPYMFIAERPLYNWSEWHGGEETWVKVLEVLNLPSLILTATIGGAVIAVHRGTSFGDYPTDTWIRALFFLAFSLVQWWTIGRVVDNALRRMVAPPSDVDQS
ncbi:MAG TPA: hypothetical protein VLK65_11310 [Vicinamibacteria bacterium]|nr:hypothetical protein [Vicinamibacteria bacterium]